MLNLFKCMHKPTSGSVASQHLVFNVFSHCPALFSHRDSDPRRQTSHATSSHRTQYSEPAFGTQNISNMFKAQLCSSSFQMEPSYLPKSLDVLSFFQQSGPTSSCCWDVGLVHRRECNTSSRYHSRRLLRVNHSEIHEPPQADRHTSELQWPTKRI